MAVNRSTNRNRRGVAFALALLCGGREVAGAGPTPAQNCESQKNGAVAAYDDCLHKAQAKFVAGGEVDTAKRDSALLKCEDKYAKKWLAAEFKADGACPSSGDGSAVRDYVAACVLSVEAALAGGSLPPDPAACQNDLALCLAQPNARTLKTGQTDCRSALGGMVSCPGSGQDGAYQQGAARSFTDNGNGTVTDHTTGLTWEKLSDNADVHDKDTTYTWYLAFTKIAALNSANFGGFNDWRMPNIVELRTLANFGVFSPPAVYPEFDTACTAGCSATTCSCAPYLGATFTWSSTSSGSSPASAWSVYFHSGAVNLENKSNSHVVRAVRGGA